MADLALLIASVVFTAGMAAMAWRSIERGNRVSPSVRSRFPIRYRWSMRYAARLHRHLRRTVAAVRSCVTSDDQLVFDVVTELEHFACAVDDQLAIAVHMPQPARRRILRELRAEVHEVDAMAERLIRLRRAWAGAQPSARTLAPIAERVEALELALRDLARFDRLELAAGGDLGELDEPVERRRRLPSVD
jgi:hypothetical protein